MEGILMGDHSDIDHSGLTGVGGSLTVQDEGTPLSTAATTMNFVGAGVAATGSGATKTITIAGDAAGTVQTFSPTWTNTGNSLGNGTLTGHYQKIADKLYWVCIVLTVGSSTTAGTGNYVIGNLPFTVKSTSPTRQIIPAYYRDTGTTNFSGFARFGAGGTATETVFFADATGTKAWTEAVPATLASTDEVVFEGILASD